MADIAWHTDIVVDKQGMNLKLKEKANGKFTLSIHPDVPSKKSTALARRFAEIAKKGTPAKTVAEAKKKVQKAINKTGARWNRWHKEAY